jgi:RNA recognition motif-containing protein
LKLYIGNLDKNVTEQDLREAFQPFGVLDSVVIIKDRSSSVSKGFGFIEMPNKAEAEAAIAGLHRKELKGRSMDVNEARPRVERPARQMAGGRRGGFGGGGNKGGKGYGGGGGRRW